MNKYTNTYFFINVFMGHPKFKKKFKYLLGKICPTCYQGVVLLVLDIPRTSLHEVPSPAHVSKSQHGDKVPTFIS